MAAFTTERWLPEGIAPLEIWDLPSRGELLYRRLGTERVEALEAAGRDGAFIDAELGEALAEAIAALGRGHPDRFEVVVLSGGLAQRPGLVEAARSRCPLDIQVRPDPNPVSHALTDVVLEIGQAVLKVSCGQRHERRARSLRMSPVCRVEDHAPRVDLRAARRRLAFQLGSFAGSFVNRLGRDCPARLVLALPCALDEVGRLGPCTYAGLDLEALSQIMKWVRGLTARSHPWRHQTVMVRLINDAEWAAYLAQQSGIEKDGLAITLGFGPGAAFFKALRRPAPA